MEQRAPSFLFTFSPFFFFLLPSLFHNDLQQKRAGPSFFKDRVLGLAAIKRNIQTPPPPKTKPRGAIMTTTMTMMPVLDTPKILLSVLILRFICEEHVFW